ncbi:MAG TPA: hypothetical protein VJZ00_22630 [Thermoanaerobaculia bacterium]|nr:hypothetical protein [Thermoanaerobaculia bacterium]
MKRTLAILITLACASAAMAANGTRIVLDTKTKALPPGTRVHVEMRAEFTLTTLPEAATPKAGAGPTRVEITDDMVKYRLAAAKPAVWDFIVGADGNVPAEQLEFQFSKILPAAPPGMFASIVFPTHYRCVLPGKTPVVVERANEYGMQYEKPSAVITRCVRFASWAPGQVGMGVLPTCDTDPRKLPGARVIAQ